MKKGFRILKFKKTSPILEIKDITKSLLMAGLFLKNSH